MDKLKEEDGQAIFEFVVFIPFFLVFFVIFLTISGSINGSINQQKATRGYFYYIVKNDSTIPFKSDLEEYAKNGVQNAGSYSFGWQKAAQGATPIAPCYKIPTILGSANSEACEDPMNQGTRESNFVRVFTTYGVCGNSYTIDPSTNEFVWDPMIGNSRLSSTCLLR